MVQNKVNIASCFMGVSIVKCKMDVVQEVEREDLVAISQVGLLQQCCKDCILVNLI